MTKLPALTEVMRMHGEFETYDAFLEHIGSRSCARNYVRALLGEFPVDRSISGMGPLDRAYRDFTGTALMYAADNNLTHGARLLMGQYGADPHFVLKKHSALDYAERNMQYGGDNTELLAILRDEK